MENNENKVGVETPTSDVSTQNSPSVDYESEIRRLKDALSKSNSENADWKRKYNSKLSEEEQVKAIQEEREAYVKSLEQKVARTELGAELSKGIKDEKVLNDVIEDLIGANNIEAIKKINKYIEARVDSAIKEHDADLLRSNPVPPPTSTTNNGGVSRKDFDKMSYAERVAFKEKNPETYKKYTE